jgi:hypothetical protein
VRAIDTVQVYASVEGSRVPRAPRDLRSFARVALGPGESRRVSVTVRGDDLAYWDEATSAWVLEPIAYEVIVAHDAAADGRAGDGAGGVTGPLPRCRAPSPRLGGGLRSQRKWSRTGGLPRCQFEHSSSIPKALPPRRGEGARQRGRGPRSQRPPP